MLICACQLKHKLVYQYSICLSNVARHAHRQKKKITDKHKLTTWGYGSRQPPRKIPHANFLFWFAPCLPLSVFQAPCSFPVPLFSFFHDICLAVLPLFVRVPKLFNSIFHFTRWLEHSHAYQRELLFYTHIYVGGEYTHMHTCLYVCACIYTYIHVCMYMCT